MNSIIKDYIKTTNFGKIFLIIEKFIIKKTNNNIWTCIFCFYIAKSQFNINLKIDHILYNNIIKYNNFEIIKEMINSNYLLYNLLPEYLKNNKNLILYCIKNNGILLKFLSNIYKNDINIVTLAIKNYPKALKYASNELQNNNKIVSLAIKDDSNNIKYASFEFKKLYFSKYQ